MHSLPLLTSLILVIFILITSVLSEATGRGGVLIFNMMTLYFLISVIIPFHGCIQYFKKLIPVSFFGTRFVILMLQKTSETVFLKVFKIALAVPGLRMLYKLDY